MSSKIEDENRAVMMLEKSVLRAKSILENEQKLKPFAMILYDDGSIKLSIIKLKTQKRVMLCYNLV